MNSNLLIKIVVIAVIAAVGAYAVARLFGFEGGVAISGGVAGGVAGAVAGAVAAKSSSARKATAGH